ncbi:hypothetical protein [Natronorubrum bangense]|uniref:hypothetical protein n=1 Tax=Natronorubrum bangense TaxID=61858 RepID=UPI0010A478A4|nr:hypothetical protein [Natronorubrum bangense]
MDKRNYTPQIKVAETDQFPLSPGLAGLLKEKCCSEEPDARYKHVRLDEDGNWQMDDHLECYLWYPGSPLQSCFYEVVEHRMCCGEIKPVREYYQVEYYRIPNLLANFNSKEIRGGHAWIVTQVNNIQLEEWYRANGVLDFSESVLDEIQNQEKQENGKTIRNECNSSMERKTKRADD